MIAGSMFFVSSTSVAFSRFCSQGLGVAWPHLNASFGQVDADSQPLSHADIWVLSLLESFLKSLQLRHRERCSAAALLLLVPISSLKNELWQDGKKTKCQHLDVVSSKFS